ncbi:MAG: hypothetical protein LLG24_00210 [Actinomycetia bacterium]|nr:hypothetical protein [Actinomycetes bacterium]
MSRRRGENGITHIKRWPDYIGGILTETGFILGLTLVAFLLAVIAQVIYR